MDNLRTANLGFLLARASQAWNRMLYQAFCDQGFSEVRPSFGALLIPLFDEDGVRISALARKAGLSKQNLTTMVRLLQRAGLVACRKDPRDGRATRIYLTPKAKRFRRIADRVLDRLERETLRVSGMSKREACRQWLRGFASLETQSN